METIEEIKEKLQQAKNNKLELQKELVKKQELEKQKIELAKVNRDIEKIKDKMLPTFVKKLMFWR